jgi:hypothetical protein
MPLDNHGARRAVNKDCPGLFLRPQAHACCIAKAGKHGRHDDIV